ncbi:MAG: DUF2760 domain-containing protein [Planctomycetes bacterium]|nr:DUF2760 domain-containing protein [Planctomycetota bacterium]
MRFLLALKVLFSRKYASKLDETASESRDNSVQVLKVLQRDGRLIDFLMEDISGFSDEQVGAAVRDVHKGCRKSLDEYFEILPAFDGIENSKVSVDSDFDRHLVKIVGKTSAVQGFSGILRHHGWKLQKNMLPKISADLVSDIIMQAEIEVE